jgi:hypothetical protein
MKQRELKIENFINESLKLEKGYKNQVTVKFLEEFNEDFFIFADIPFNEISLLQKRNNINHILELFIKNEKYHEFDVRILNSLVNLIDDYIELSLLQEKEY